ncbi:MAG: hypothetical protein J6Z33_07530 [Lachnospiraceae bacterium]|nr:hypothetical protein [Lachnospiraceae bacterium]
MERKSRLRDSHNAARPENAKSDYQQYELSGKDFNVPSGMHYEDVIREHMKKVKNQDATQCEAKK